MDCPALDLTITPMRHPHCCLSLSLTLLETLTAILLESRPPDCPQTVLSVGSGTGLLETLLMKHISTSVSSAYSVEVEGIEVRQSDAKDDANIYLLEQRINLVQGTWSVSPRLMDEQVTTVIFVYPRQPKLVSSYISALMDRDISCKTVVWLGPVADWTDFSSCFQGDQSGRSTERNIRRGRDAGLLDYEMMAVLSIK